MHDNPRPTEEEHELAQTERLDDEEEMRGGQSPREQAEDDEED
jgi:hypothetical protein